MNRGRRSEKIFLDNEDYTTFIQLMQEACRIFNIRISAYCLMTNHYHILLQTPEANLSQCMRHINGVYTQRCNRRYNVDGQLFRGRFKAILVEEDSYLLELVKYIHKNPLQAGMVDNLDKYLWNSHKGYMSQAGKWNWLYKDFIFSMLTDNKEHYRKAYLDLISGPDEKEMEKVFNQKKLPVMLGTKDFVEKIKDRFYNTNYDSQVPQSRTFLPSITNIKRLVERAYKVKPEILTVSRRGYYNEPRNVAIYLSRKYCGKMLLEIGREFNTFSYSSVSTLVENMKKIIQKDRKLQKRVMAIEKNILKSQNET